MPMDSTASPRTPDRRSETTSQQNAAQAPAAQASAVQPSTVEPDRSDQFNALYNELDAYLRRELSVEHRSDFMDMVNEGVRRGLVRQTLVNELRDCKALRNLLVHTSRYPHEALAEPSAWGLEHFRQMVQDIVHPERVYPAFRRRVELFDPRDPLASALRYMAENDFSQVVVRSHGHLRLLSNDGITRWLAAQAPDGRSSPAETRLGDALPYEPEGSFVLLARRATIEEARNLFDRAPGLPVPRVQALIITESGRDGEEPLGFATPWDLIREED
jgi:hypothetical protein